MNSGPNGPNLILKLGLIWVAVRFKPRYWLVNLDSMKSVIRFYTTPSSTSKPMRSASASEVRP